jgi:HSP20 family molecular chaperone IbpA
MAIVESESKDLKNNEKGEEVQENKFYYSVFPDMTSSIDYENRKIEVEVSLPGVAKQNIELKVLPTWFHLKAKRNHIEYGANQCFGKKIIPEKTTAKYDNGLLKITAYIKDPFDGAREITV